MHHWPSIPSRRRFLQRATAGAAGLLLPQIMQTPGAFAEMLTLTPRQTEGPFYPNHLPLDTDNDLLVINDAITPGVGEITHLSGTILDSTGAPLRGAVVEIWQVDGNGVYLHTGDRRGDDRDSNFQGFGRFLTGQSGEYYFRTIKPVPYPGRAPHIHFKVKRHNQSDFVTQCYVQGHELNERDRIYRSIRDPRARGSVTVDFAPVPDSKLGELAARFDIVLGVTPSDA